MLSVTYKLFMLNVIMLSVIAMSVVAPYELNINKLIKDFPALHFSIPIEVYTLTERCQIPG
jgi:hypothetical protein